MAESETTQSGLEETSAGRRHASNLVGKIKILAFVCAIILTECIVAAMFIPSSAETAAMAQAMHAGEDGLALPDDVENEQLAQELADRREVDLGEFGVTSYQPITNTTLRIDFHLFATCKEDDERELLALVEDNQHRFREQVLVILRSSEMTDLTDAGLGLIKRKILEKTNRLLGKALVQEIIFSDFAFVEQ